MRRTRRSRQRSKQAFWGAVLGGGALLALAAIAVGVALVGRTPPTDPATDCLLGATPTAHTLVLIDATDRLAARHKRRLETAVAQEIARLAPGDRFTLLRLDDGDAREPTRLFSRCHPGDGSTVNALIANPSQARARFEQRFQEPLTEALKAAVSRRDGALSPIVEAMAAAARDPDLDPATPRRRLVLVSDLLEHHPGGFSLLRPGPALAAFDASPEGPRARLDLSGVAVRLVVVDWPDRADAQRNAVEVFWRPLLSRAGAQDVTWEPPL